MYERKPKSGKSKFLISYNHPAYVGRKDSGKEKKSSKYIKSIYC